VAILPIGVIIFHIPIGEIWLEIVGIVGLNS
jgi:hypothetical protein